jgi:hypothetical protein
MSDCTSALEAYRDRMDEHFARHLGVRRDNARIIENIPYYEWEPIDSYHLIAGEPLRPVWRAPVTDRWFAWRPVRTRNGWAWLEHVERTIVRATRRSLPPYPRRRVVIYRKEPA